MECGSSSHSATATVEAISVRRGSSTSLRLMWDMSTLYRTMNRSRARASCAVCTSSVDHGARLSWCVSRKVRFNMRMTF